MRFYIFCWLFITALFGGLAPVFAGGAERVPLGADSAVLQTLPGLMRMPANRVAKEAVQVSFPLMAAGLCVQNGKESVRDLRNDIFKAGRVTHVDDYLQYAPVVLMAGLKVCGYKGRSSWGRMLTADAFSVALTAAMVNGIKYTARVQRPDGAVRNSFPSGHTATAFMAATMLHKEYGQTRSVWFSAGGYAVAAAVGLMRIINNRHWVSDVLMGAGLGIFSVEAGYCFADLIFKEKGLRYALLEEPRFNGPDFKPSFVGLNMGGCFPIGEYKLPGGGRVRPSGGAFAGVEGAWFGHRNFGVGAEAGVSNFSVNQKHYDRYAAYAAAYFSYPLHPCAVLGAKAGGGYGYLTEKLFNSRHSADFVAGVSFLYQPAARLGLKIYADYRYCSRLHNIFAGGSVMLFL